MSGSRSITSTDYRMNSLSGTGTDIIVGVSCQRMMFCCLEKGVSGGGGGGVWDLRSDDGPDLLLSAAAA